MGVCSAELLVQLAEASAALAKKLGLPPHVQQAAAAAIAIAAADLGSTVLPIRPQQRRIANLSDRREPASNRAESAFDTAIAANADAKEPGADAVIGTRSARLQRKRARALSDSQTAVTTGAVKRSTRYSGAIDIAVDASDKGARASVKGACASDTSPAAVSQLLSDVENANKQTAKLAATKGPRTKSGARGKPRGKARAKPRGKGKRGRNKADSSSLGSLSDSSVCTSSDSEFQPQRRRRLSDMLGLPSNGCQTAASALDTTASGGATYPSADAVRRLESDSCQTDKKKLSDTKPAKALPGSKGLFGKGRISNTSQAGPSSARKLCTAMSSQFSKAPAVQTSPGKTASGRAAAIKPEAKCTKVGFTNRPEATGKLPGSRREASGKLEEDSDGVVTAFRIPKRAPKPLSKEDLKRIAFARARSEAAARAAAREAEEKRAADAAAASRAAKLAERRAESAQKVLGGCLVPQPTTSA